MNLKSLTLPLAMAFSLATGAATPALAQTPAQTAPQTALPGICENMETFTDFRVCDIELEEAYSDQLINAIEQLHGHPDAETLLQPVTLAWQTPECYFSNITFDEIFEAYTTPELSPALRTKISTYFTRMADCYANVSVAYDSEAFLSPVSEYFQETSERYRRASEALQP